MGKAEVSNKEGLARALAVIEDRGWTINECDTGDVGNEKVEGLLLEWWSLAGEDICIETTRELLRDDLQREYEHFDADNHVELWVEMRGNKGVPDSYTEHFEDARDIRKELGDFSRICAEAWDAVRKDTIPFIVEVTKTTTVHYAVAVESKAEALRSIDALFDEDCGVCSDLDCSPDISFAKRVVPCGKAVDGTWHSHELDENGYSLLR